MSLPSAFSLAQSSLQDYIDCPRRFELKYLLRIEWPALISESYLELRRYLRLGSQFHQLAHQYLLGLPVEMLNSQITDVELQIWFQNFLQSPIVESSGGILHPEKILQSYFGGVRLVAKYDLLIVQESDRLTIVDWKTNRFRPSSAHLSHRVQTRLYPFLAVEAGGALFAGREHIEANDIQMIYWFTNHPDDPEIITYSNAQYDQDKQYISDLIMQINANQPGKFPLTDDLKRCQFCMYRSLCERGGAAGEWGDQAELTIESQLDQVIQSLESGIDQMGEAWL